MKKIFALILIFSLLFSFNINASKNVYFNDFEVKSKVFDEKNSKKIKTIQKIFNTKIGKWFVKKAIKKLKNNSKNDIKNNIKDAKKPIGIFNNPVVIIVIGLVLVAVGIGLIIGNYVAIGIILALLGLIAVVAL